LKTDRALLSGPFGQAGLARLCTCSRTSLRCAGSDAGRRVASGGPRARPQDVVPAPLPPFHPPARPLPSVSGKLERESCSPSCATAPLTPCAAVAPPPPDCSCAPLRLTFPYLVDPLVAIIVERYSPIGRFLHRGAMGTEHGPFVAGSPPLPFSPSFSPFCVRLHLAELTRAILAAPCLALTGHRTPAPPCHHAWRRAQCRVHLTAF
jgi:hypothetical protein